MHQRVDRHLSFSGFSSAGIGGRGFAVRLPGSPPGGGGKKNRHAVVDCVTIIFQRLGFMMMDYPGMYYVHGRWYNQDTGLFMSPDAKGEYFYGSGQDPINWDWIAEQGIAVGKSGPVGRAIVLGGGGFVRDTAWANYQIFYPPAEWTYWDRLGNTTRGVAPIFLAEGVVTLGPPAAQAGAAYLGRSLLGRAITGGATACAARAEACGNTFTTSAYRIAEQGGRNAGFLRAYANRSIPEIQKAIQSLEERAADHVGYLRNPAEYAQQWNSMSADAQQGLLRFWEKESQLYSEQAEVLRGLLGYKLQGGP
jgi:hypothetical protein